MASTASSLATKDSDAFLSPNKISDTVDRGGDRGGNSGGDGGGFSASGGLGPTIVKHLVQARRSALPVLHVRGTRTDTLRTYNIESFLRLL